MKTVNGFKSMKGRLTFWFLVVSLLPLIIAGAVSYHQSVRSIKARELDKLTSIRDLKVEQLNRWLDERIGDIRAVSEDPEIRTLETMIRHNPDHLTGNTVEHARQLLKRYLKHYDDYAEIFILHPDSGRVEISTDPHREGEDSSGRPFFTTVLKTRQVHIQGIYRSRTVKGPSMVFSIPILCQTHNSHIIGILVTRVDLKRSIYPLLSNRIGMGATGETLIVDQNVTALNELRWHRNAPLKLTIQAKPAVLGARGDTGIIETRDYRGVKVLAAYTFIPRTRWGFVAKQDLSEVYAPMFDLLKNMGMILLVAAVVVYALALFLARAVSRPIREMAGVADRIEAGDLTARNRITSRDEIGFLAASFNTMAESIASQQHLREIDNDITRTLADAKDLPAFRTDIVKKLVAVTGSQMGAYFVFNPDDDRYEPFFSIGISHDRLEPFDASGLEGELGMVLETRKITRITDIPKDTVFHYRTFTGSLVPREIISIPIIIKEVVSGIVCLAAVTPYPREVLEIMDLPWTTGFGTALSNMQANEKTARLAEELQRANETLQTQTEELQNQAEELQQGSEELQQQNLELEIQQRQLEEADRLKDEFLSNVSHELRTPLNSVMALSRALMIQTREKLSDEEFSYLGIIERNGKNLLALINDILDLSKIESGHLEVIPKPFDIKAVVDALLERMEPIANEKGLELHSRITENIPEIESDEDKVHQILQNLLSNAVKFTDSGAVSVSISMENDTLFIQVQDTGIGIADDDQSQIFEEFRQVDGTPSRHYEGTGLGLAIAFKTARLLNGDITVQSRPGEGAVFTVSLPVRWKGDPAVLSHDRQLPSVKSDPSGIPPTAPSGKRILLVEDNDIAVIQVSDALHKQGYMVDVAGNGQEALDHLAHTLPDGIILDLMMPEVDGFEVLERMRSTPATEHLPVLVLTAKDLTTEELSRLSANHIQQLVHKGDIDRNGLLEKTARMLNITESHIKNGEKDDQQDKDE